MQQYATRPSWNNQGTEEMKNSLTHFERKLASNLTLVQVVGKRGRRVPIIISKEVKETMDMLILTRIKAGVQNENPYIFAIPGTSKSHMRGHDCVKKWCTEAQLQSPELITGTKLRKYIATVCQVFDLTENEQDWLARHLGHDIRVHREFYRLQENAVELTKVSRLLLAVDQGEAQTFSGMKLKDINIEDLPAIGEETNDDSEKEMRDDASEGETRDDASEGDDKLEPGDEARSDSEHCFINKTKRGAQIAIIIIQLLEMEFPRTKLMKNDLIKEHVPKLPGLPKKKKLSCGKCGYLLKKTIYQEKRSVQIFWKTIQLSGTENGPI
ncbi:hypothetical protein JTB14_006795 [Gonioctena quinquepunctata]|nr:hypothetical protein JTB14_006795 [Gonioctena quinquepunctata]